MDRKDAEPVGSAGGLGAARGERLCPCTCELRTPLASGSDVALRALGTPAGGPVRSLASLSCHIRPSSHLGRPLPPQMGEGGTSGFLCPSAHPCHPGRTCPPVGALSHTSLFAVGGLQGRSEKVCWVTAPAWRLEVCPTALDPPGGKGHRVVAMQRHRGRRLCSANCCVLAQPV